MLYLIGLSVPLILFLKWALSSDPVAVNGVYRQLGKWYTLKYALFRLLMGLRRWQNSGKKTGQSAGYGVKSRNSPEDMDRVQDLPKEHPLAVDAVYFNGASRQGDFLVTATARRHDNVVQTIICLRIPDIGLLELPCFPDTTLQGSFEGGYSTDGLVIRVIEPMKKWKICFTGKLRLVETKKLVDVSFDLDWTAITDYFDFDTDLHPSSLCDAMAREIWSREFFNTLKQAHQTHYEQFGEITGTVNIQGFGDRGIKIQGVRDHSYGNTRDWKDLHRYILQYVYTEDGMAVCFGAISMPRTMSRLVLGYIFHPNGTMDAVSSTDFEFYNLGDDGKPPPTFIFNFVAGEKSYKLVGKEVQRSVFFMGKDWDGKIYERMCMFTLNGVPAWGISEWDYGNYKGKAATMKEMSD